MNGKFAAKAADFFNTKKQPELARRLFFGIKKVAKPGVWRTFHSPNGAKRESRRQSLFQLAQACLQAIFRYKKIQQTGGLTETLHSQNGAKRERRSQSSIDFFSKMRLFVSLPGKVTNDPLSFACLKQYLLKNHNVSGKLF